MPFLSSTTALTVYKLDNPAAVTASKLKQHAFRSIDDIPEPKGWGWVNIDDMFDPDWDVSVPEKGQFMCFALRVDTRKIPPAVLKKHLAEAYREELEKVRAEGKTFISRTRKKELKELHVSRLLARSEPVPVAVDVVLDTANGLLYAGTTSKTLLELLEEQCATCFGVTPVRLTLGGMEEHSELNEQAVERFMGIIYVGSLQTSFGEHSYTVSEAGQAMLTRTGEDGEADGVEVMVKNAPVSTNASLEAGLTIKQMRMEISRNGDESLLWTLTLNNDFSFSSLQTPKVEKPQGADDPDAAMLEKIYLIEHAVGIMHAVFGQMYASSKA